MSRVREIVDNHHNLDGLLAVLKHHALSAEYACRAILTTCEQQNDDESDMEELICDLKQYYARL